MRRLVFIDDDPTELDEFAKIVEGVYTCEKIRYPEDLAKLFSDPGPDIFVSDLYLPPKKGDSCPTPGQREEAAKFSILVAARFAGLYVGSPHEDIARDKARLKDTMSAINEAYQLLERQWRALGQSPDHGVELLRELKTRYSEVPFVFYSRKITPKDVIHVLQAGAVDAIQKGVTRDQVLARLERALKIWHRKDLQSIRAEGLNVNTTVFPGT